MAKIHSMAHQAPKDSPHFLPLPALHSSHTRHRAARQRLSMPSRTLSISPRIPRPGKPCVFLSRVHSLSSYWSWPSVSFLYLQPRSCLSQGVLCELYTLRAIACSLFSPYWTSYLRVGIVFFFISLSMQPSTAIADEVNKGLLKARPGGRCQ